MENPQSFVKKLPKKVVVRTTRIANKTKCVYYKVREIAGSYIKFRNIQVRGVSKYEVRGKKKHRKRRGSRYGQMEVWATRLCAVQG